MLLFSWDHREVLGELAWNFAGHGRASKAAAEVKVLMGWISVLLVRCVTGDFAEHISICWAACL